MVEVVYFGGGYVALTASVHFAKAKIPTIIYDIDPTVVTGINRGNPRGREFLSYLHTDVSILVNKGLLRATHNLTDLAGKTNFILAVPSERKGEIWLDPIFESVEKIVRLSETPPTILIESTIPPGTTDKIIERLHNQFNVQVGEDYFLAVCPRKDWFADQEKNVTTLPRIVGGVTEQCTERALDILQNISHDIRTATYKVAEFTKSIENSLFHSHIAYGHQLALAFPDKDIATALELACLHWRLPKLYLGFGTAGRCVPMGTKALLNSLYDGAPTRVKNSSLSLGVAALDTDLILRTRIIDAVKLYYQRNKNSRIMIMGLGYRPDFADTGLSPGLEIAQRLTSFGFPVVVHDTLYSAIEIKKNWGLEFLPLSELPSCDLILLATPHSSYLPLPHSATLWRSGQTILDANGVWNGCRKLFAEKGVMYKRVGDAGWLNIK